MRPRRFEHSVPAIPAVLPLNKRNTAASPAFILTPLSALRAMKTFTILCFTHLVAASERGGNFRDAVPPAERALLPPGLAVNMPPDMDLVEEDATAWVVHTTGNNGEVHVVQDNTPECPVTCKAMRDISGNGEYVEVRPGEKRIDAVHVFHSATARQGCHQAKKAGLFSGLIIRGYGFHMAASGCENRGSDTDQTFMTHNCKHEVDTGHCTCTCNYMRRPAGFSAANAV